MCVSLTWQTNWKNNLFHARVKIRESYTCTISLSLSHSSPMVWVACCGDFKADIVFRSSFLFCFLKTDHTRSICLRVDRPCVGVMTVWKWGDNLGSLVLLWVSTETWVGFICGRYSLCVYLVGRVCGGYVSRLSHWWKPRTSGNSALIPQAIMLDCLLIVLLLIVIMKVINTLG